MIINAWDQCVAAGGDRIIVSHYSREVRACRPAQWVVTRIKDGKSIATNSESAWYDYGKMTFSHGSGESKKAALAEAFSWIGKKFGKNDFVRNRMGDYVEREVNEKFPIPKRESAK